MGPACALLPAPSCSWATADSLWRTPGFSKERESGDLDRLLREQRASARARLDRSPPLPRGARRRDGRSDRPHCDPTSPPFRGRRRRDRQNHSPARRRTYSRHGAARAGRATSASPVTATHSFAALKDLRIKDEIQFSTLNGDFRYVVESLLVVEPDNVGVLAPSSENVLTLVTCYPFFYIGAAPKRFVVRARQVSPQTVARSTVE